MENVGLYLPREGLNAMGLTMYFGDIKGKSANRCKELFFCAPKLGKRWGKILQIKGVYNHKGMWCANFAPLFAGPSRRPKGGASRI
jgi:hypothetical protein